MNNVSVTVFARTDVGMQRAGNEDSFLVADLTTGNVGLGPDMSTHRVGERGSLMVVSDGMGGAVAGEIASELAVTTIRDALMEMPLDLAISDRLKIATEIANERIWNHAQENPELSGMGATITAVLVHETMAYIAQVGDSRAYLIRGEQIKQLTKDQSLAQMLLDTGAIEPEQAASVPQNVIMQALGTQPTVKVAMTAVELCRNDYLLLCSDGLSNKIDAREMRQTAQGMDDLTAACRRLVELANQRGGEDNITVIIARFDGEALHSASESSTITGSFRALNQEYMSDAQTHITTQLGAPPSPQPGDDLSATTLVMPALPPSPKPEPPAPETAELATEEAIRTPLEERPQAQAAAATHQSAPATSQAPLRTRAIVAKRKSYAWIWISFLLSLLLIAAAFFAYRLYLGQRPRPSTIEQPASEEPQPEVPRSEEPKSQEPSSQEPQTAPPNSEQSNTEGSR